MTLSKQQLEALHKMLALTKTQELTCDEVLAKMAEFAEVALAGDSIPDTFSEIEHHLALCEECDEEYTALLKALENDEHQAE